MTSDVVAFLRARLDEDERIASAAAGPDSASWESTGEHVSGIGLSGMHTEGYVDDVAAIHIARHDPARVLREVEAKRRIVAEHVEINGECMTCVYIGDDEDGGGNMRRYREHAEYPCTTVDLLALPYADHPDYREDWRPQY